MMRLGNSNWLGAVCALAGATFAVTACSTETDADLDDAETQSESEAKGGKRRDAGTDAASSTDGGSTSDTGSGADAGVTPPPPTVNADDASKAAKLFGAGQYVANGTVFTRSVANMPLAPNSAAITAYSLTVPTKVRPQPDAFPWLMTSLNTVHYNIPAYVVDSTNGAQPTAKFSSQDARVTTQPDLVTKTTGAIPFPTYGVPDSIGDHSLAIYDRGTGLLREYFYVIPETGGWNFRASGYYQAAPGFGGLPVNNFWMQLTKGSSSVVKMLNTLSQVGLDELRGGVIQHAVSVTLPNAKRGVTSFPALGSDGTDDDVNAPAEGQWFRIDPSVNLDALPLKPLTRVIAKAVQKYGGYGADKNLWCYAFNAEHPINETAAGKPDPWTAGGDLNVKYGSTDVNDFPWKYVQWAPVNWADKGTDASVL